MHDHAQHRVQGRRGLHRVPQGLRSGPAGSKVSE